jgi:hypothetical protein
LQEKGIEAKGEIMFGLSPQIVAVFIPILAVIGTFAMIITVVIMGSRQKELEHRERIIAMEKGMEIPKEPDKVRRPPHLTMRAWGLVLSAVGIIVFLGIWVEEGCGRGGGITYLGQTGEEGKIRFVAGIASRRNGRTAGRRLLSRPRRLPYPARRA